MKEHFGEYLRRIRKSKKMSIEKLAEASGLSYSGIQRIERNERGTPKPSTIRLLAQGLREPYEVLMEKAGYMSEDEYNYQADPTIPPEVKELLDSLESLPPEERALIINQAITFSNWMKAQKKK